MLPPTSAAEMAGCPGIELAFHRDQFNAFDLRDEDLVALCQRFEKGAIRPSCISTPTLFFLADGPRDPLAPMTHRQCMSIWRGVNSG